MKSLGKHRHESGLSDPWTNHSVTWSAKRHRHYGNFYSADGSVAMLSSSGLSNLLATPDQSSNLLCIP